MNTLTWDDVKDGAREVFNVWFDGSELEWAERAWATLGEAGLTGYRDAVEETRVRLRFLALASIYWDFCRLGADEECGWDELHRHGTEDLGIQPLRLGQVVGSKFEADDFASEELDLVESALRHAIDQERPAIGAALIKAHGDEWKFLKALFASIKPKPDPEDEEADDEPDFTPSARVMEWITQGMPSL